MLSHPQYLSNNLTEDSLQEFFASGEQHVEHVLETIRTTMRPDFRPDRILDYGCGTGRLVVPFAAHAKDVVGVDVSPKMLELARANCMKFGVASARMLQVDETNSLQPESFDLVHSYIVFQHIPVARGERILRQLLGLIADGGVGALHFTYSDASPPLWSMLRRSARVAAQYNGLFQGLLNLRRHLPFSSPSMQANFYSMNRIFEILLESNFSNLHVEFSNHAGLYGAMIYAVKTSSVPFG